uniref:Uncharacterized protein n=1 Tax=Triticum urartu TaxID=4572 RepID=A0A8R7PP63_TRIUA
MLLSASMGNKMDALFRQGSVEVLSSAHDFHDHNAKAIDIGLLRDL